MCECIKQLDADIQERTGDPEACLETAINFSKSTVMPNIIYTYHKKKKDGTLEKRERVSIVIANFCPFCGVSYE